jgi:hypothetical protein
MWQSVSLGGASLALVPEAGGQCEIDCFAWQPDGARAMINVKGLCTGLEVFAIASALKVLKCF